MFLEWAVRANPDMLVLPGGADARHRPRRHRRLGLRCISITAAIFAAGFGAAGFLAQGRSISAIIPVVWSAAAVFTPLALLIALYARIAHLDRSIPFAILAVVLAAAFGAATEILTKRDTRPGLAISIALFATGTLGALALALTFALEKGWLTIALALMSLGTAWISMQRPIPFLRSLAAILAGIVVLRIGYEPRIVGDAVGTTPIFNWLLWGYGIPALSFWVGSIFLRRRGDDAPLRTRRSPPRSCSRCCWRSWKSATAVNGGDVYRDIAGLTEVGAAGLRRAGDGDRAGAAADPHRQHRPQRQRGPADGVRRTGRRVRTVVARQSRCSGRSDVGGTFINLLLLGYAMPAVLALLLSYAVAGRRAAAYANTIAAGALILALTYITLEIRTALSRPGPDQRRHQRRRAIHLLDRVAGVRRGAARHRHRRSIRSARGWRRPW